MSSRHVRVHLRLLVLVLLSYLACFQMFNGATSFTNGDISFSWNPLVGTDYTNMFRGATSFGTSESFCGGWGMTWPSSGLSVSNMFLNTVCSIDDLQPTPIYYADDSGCSAGWNWMCSPCIGTCPPQCASDLDDGDPCNDGSVGGDGETTCRDYIGPCGSYDCDCNPGWVFLGGTCEPTCGIDYLDNNPCNNFDDPNATCVTTTPYGCDCSLGASFRPDLGVCEPG